MSGPAEQGTGLSGQDHGAENEDSRGSQRSVVTLGQSHGLPHTLAELPAHHDAVGAVNLPGDLAQVVDIHRPGRVDGDAHDGVGHRLQSRQNPLGVLVRHNAQDRHEVLEAEGLQ